MEEREGQAQHRQISGKHGSLMPSQFEQKPDIVHTPARSVIVYSAENGSSCRINVKPHAHTPFAAIQAAKARALQAKNVGGVSQLIDTICFQSNQ